MPSSSDNNEQKFYADAGIHGEFCFKEIIFPGLKYEMQLKRIFTSTKSEFQDIDVVDACFGKMLITDGLTQSAQFDEFVYHESLVHPALMRFARASGKPPETVMIGGGGELATAREVLRHTSVKRVVMVDIDSTVVEVCKKYLPEWGGETVCNNPRFELIIGDAHEWILNTQEVFDVIIMDISDPVEAGPGIALYTQEFYQFAVTKLNPGGVFVTQAGMASAVPDINHHKEHSTSANTMSFGPIKNTLASVFDVAMGYSTSIPSFGSDWGFVMAFNADQKESAEEEWRMPSIKTIEDLIEQQIEGGLDSMKHYDGQSHCRMFSLPRPLRLELEKDDRIMTKANPIFMFNG